MNRSSVRLCTLALGTFLLCACQSNAAPSNDSSSSSESSINSPLSSKSTAVRPAAPVAPIAFVDIAIKDRAFTPSALTIKKGTRVTWTNYNSVTHSVTADNEGPQSSVLKPGQQFSYTFTKVGTFPYHCAVHKGMNATITVTE